MSITASVAQPQPDFNSQERLLLHVKGRQPVAVEFRAIEGGYEVQAVHDPSIRFTLMFDQASLEVQAFQRADLPWRWSSGDFCACPARWEWALARDLNTAGRLVSCPYIAPFGMPAKGEKACISPPQQVIKNQYL